MHILRLATALPKECYTTEQLLESFPCALPETVRENVGNLGVGRRYLIRQPQVTSGAETILGEDGLVSLCCDACGKAVKEAGLSMADINYLVATYDVSPFLSPGLGQLLIPKLSLDPYVRYVNAQGIASTAFMKALELAQNHLALHLDDHVLICLSGVSSCWFQNQVRGMRDVMGIDQINKIEDETRRQLELRKWVATIQYFLFGDGAASAIVANNGHGLSVLRIAEITNVSKMDYLAGYTRLTTLNGPFKFGLYSHLGKEILELGAQYTSMVLEKLFGKDSGIPKKAKKWAVHTGSEKILNLLAERNAIDPEKLDESRRVLKECGNLAGASLPFILDRILSGNEMSRGDIVLMLGYGWGFSAAACLLEYM